MKYTRIFLFAMLSFLMSFCGVQKSNPSSIKQGVSGRVLWMEGNFMPSPDRPNRSQGTPAKRTVYIYQLTKLSEVSGESPLFAAVRSTLVAKVKTDKQGYFSCQLSPGKYSIFTREEEDKFFANLFDGDGNIAPFAVKADEVTKYDVSVNYKAAF